MADKLDSILYRFWWLIILYVLVVLSIILQKYFNYKTYNVDIILLVTAILFVCIKFFEKQEPSVETKDGDNESDNNIQSRRVEALENDIIALRNHLNEINEIIDKKNEGLTSSAMNDIVDNIVQRIHNELNSGRNVFIIEEKKCAIIHDLSISLSEEVVNSEGAFFNPIKEKMISKTKQALTECFSEDEINSLINDQTESAALKFLNLHIEKIHSYIDKQLIKRLQNQFVSTIDNALKQLPVELSAHQLNHLSKMATEAIQNEINHFNYTIQEETKKKIGKTIEDAIVIEIAKNIASFLQDNYLSDHTWMTRIYDNVQTKVKEKLKSLNYELSEENISSLEGSIQNKLETVIEHTLNDVLRRKVKDVSDMIDSIGKEWKCKAANVEENIDVYFKNFISQFVLREEKYHPTIKLLSDNSLVISIRQQVRGEKAYVFRQSDWNDKFDNMSKSADMAQDKLNESFRQAFPAFAGKGDTNKEILKKVILDHLYQAKDIDLSDPWRYREISCRLGETDGFKDYLQEFKKIVQDLDSIDNEADKLFASHVMREDAYIELKKHCLPALREALPIAE